MVGMVGMVGMVAVTEKKNAMRFDEQRIEDCGRSF